MWCNLAILCQRVGKGIVIIEKNQYISLTGDLAWKRTYLTCVKVQDPEFDP